MHNDTHPQTLGMDVTPMMYVGGGGVLSFGFHVYAIRKYCLVSVTVRIKENYKKTSHLSFCGENSSQEQLQ